MKKIAVVIVAVILITVQGFGQTVSTFVNLNKTNYGDGITVSASGDLFVAGDYQHSDLLKVSPAGGITTFASGLNSPTGAYFDSAGNLYINSYHGSLLYKFTPDGTRTTFATGLNGPAGVFVSSDDRIFVTSYGSNFSGTGKTVREISSEGQVTTYKTGGGLQDVIGVVVDEAGNVYASNWQSGKIYKITPDKTITLFADIPGTINQITYGNETLYIPSPSNHKIYAVDLAGNLSTLAGTGVAGSQNGDALSATFNKPNSIAISVTGDSLFVLDTKPGLIRIIDLNNHTATKKNTGDFEGFSLNQNYPNPFNPKTILSYSLSENAFVSLKVFDVLGHEISRLVNKNQTRNDYSLSFDASNLAAGIYFYRLEVNNYQITKKMNLLW